MQADATAPKNPEFLIQEGWGARLKQERKRLAYTQAEIAKLSGVSVVTYQQYEREEFEPRLGYLNQLDRLELNMRFILFGEEIEQGSQKTLIESRVAALKAFKAMEDYVARLGQENISSEEKFAMFEVLRSQAAPQVWV